MTMRSLVTSTVLFAAISTGAFAEVSLSGTLTDVEDGNRFFTRLGGEAQEDLTLTGLEEGMEYILTTALIDAASGEEVDNVETTFTADSPEKDLSISLSVPRNEGELNIDYITKNTLRSGDTRTALIDVTGDAADPARGIQVHSIQRINVLSVADASDGNKRLHGEGGKVEVTVGYENMVEGYKYTIWGQMLTPSGQSRGIFAVIPDFAPTTKAGELTLVFDIPSGLDGTSVTPSVGIYHQNRVEIREDGNLIWLLDAPKPVMIASDTDLDNDALMIEVGVPFGQHEYAADN